MVLPVLQSLLTLGLLVAAFGFMARRLWQLKVLINTGTRGEESLTDNPGVRTRTMAVDRLVSSESGVSTTSAPLLMITTRSTV